MGAIRRHAVIVQLVVAAAVLLAVQPSRAEDVVFSALITSSAVVDAENAIDVGCHILPVQDGYGARAAGQPGYGLLPKRPDCDRHSAAAAMDESTIPAAASDLNNHGGPVVTTAQSYALYLNCASVSTCWGNPNGFLGDLFASNFIHVVDQYIGSTANARYTVASTSVNLTGTVPHAMSVADIRAAVITGVRFLFPGGGGGGYNRIYNLFLPSGQDTCFSSTDCYSPDVPSTFTFCAYHDSMNTTDAVGNPIHVVYTVMPYQNVGGCQLSGGPNGTLIDSTNSVLSHEIFELITDPDLNAWYRSSDGQEIGDICRNTVANPITLNGHNYALQEEYSNLAHACVSGSPPANDNFANAIAMHARETAGTNVNATKEAGEPSHAGNGGGASVWWSFTALKSGSVTISTAGSNFDTLLGVYTGGAVNSLTLVAANDDCGSTLTSCVTFNATAGTLYRMAVDGFNGATGSIQLSISGLPGVSHDFDGDGKRDLAVYRPTTGEWFIFGSATGFQSRVFGAPSFTGLGDTPVAADFDGDGKTDIAIYRQATGEWFIFGSATGFQTRLFGAPAVSGLGDTPVPADFDGDGKADLAIYRKATGEWFIFGSATGFQTRLFGAPAVSGLGDTPVPADFDGDGKADLAIYRKATGEWFIFGSATGFQTRLFGAPAVSGLGDTPVPADFDGDGKTDLAVYRKATGEWFIFGSATGFRTIVFGAPAASGLGDTPVPGDFDGDGQADIAVRRSATAEWFVLQSLIGQTQTVTFGAPSDLPLPQPAQ